MDYAFVMRVLDRPADVLKEQQPIAASQLVGVAVVGDRQARNVLHGEPWTPAGCLARVEKLGDVRMVEQSQRLPLGFEARDQRPGSGMLDDFERYAPPNGLALFRQEDNTHAALAEHADGPVWPISAGPGRRAGPH